MTEYIAVSVIIPVFRRITFLRTLRSLQSQTLPAAEFEAILVFDGNRPERFAAKDVEGTEFQLRMIDQEQSGAASARNRGAREARGRILVFLDDDIEAVPDLLKIHLAAHDSTDKAIVVFGPVGTDPQSPDTFLRRNMDTWKHYYFSRCEQRLSTDPFYFCSANFSIPREVMLEAGGFDTAFKGYGWEEADFGIRLKNRGVTFLYEPKAMASELYVKTPAEASGAYARAKGRNEVLFVRNHPSYRQHSTLKEAFHGKRRIRAYIRLCWNAPALARLVATGIPLEEKRFRADSLLHFWLGVRDSGIAWTELQHLFATRVLILAYHDVPTKLDPRSWLDVSQSAFTKQMKLLERLGYKAIRFRDFVSWKQEGTPLPQRALILTFDDGYQSFSSFVAPLLKQKNLPACAFLSTSMVGRHNTWDEGNHYQIKNLMTWEDIQRLEEQIEFGGHGAHHLDLTLIPGPEAEKEIEECAKALQSRGCALHAFSYPYGSVPPGTLVAALQDCGFQYAVTTEEGFNTIDTDLFHLKRVLIEARDDSVQFRFKVRFGKTMMARPRRWVRHSRQRFSRKSQPDSI